MFRLFLGIVLLTSAIYSMSTNAITTESTITDAAEPQTTTPVPTLEDLANKFEILLAEQREFKSALLGTAPTTSTKTPNNVQKVIGFLGNAARVSFKNMANAVAVVALIGLFRTDPEEVYYPRRYRYYDIFD